MARVFISAIFWGMVGGGLVLGTAPIWSRWLP
jgi:hypothetical protein